ncbi:L-2-amino-thiazoline-4-carboxylic acid hydrolase [Candidatus Bipolaricaulota bacterium]
MQAHALAIELLCAMDQALGRAKAMELAKGAFARYMIAYYSDVLQQAPARTQSRFDAFRTHYEGYAHERDYVDIVLSNATTLGVRFRRCPFHELLMHRGIGYFIAGFCQADAAFTAACLPGVHFARSHEIAVDGEPCDHTWRFDLRNRLGHPTAPRASNASETMKESN